MYSTTTDDKISIILIQQVQYSLSYVYKLISVDKL